VVLGVGALVAVALALWVAFKERTRHQPTSPPGEAQKTDAVQSTLSGSNVAAADPVEAPYSTPSTMAPELAALVNRNAQDRVTGDITSKIPRIRNEEDVSAVVYVLLDTQDDDTVRNEAANLLRRSGYEGLTGDLIKVLDSPEEGARFRAFCVQHLWMNVKKAGPDEHDRIRSKLYEALADRHVPVRREALLALVRMRDQKGEETAVQWLTAEKVEGVRDAAIRCVAELGLREHTPTIRKHLHDEDEVVRIAAIVALSQWGHEESRPAIEEAAKSTSFRLRRCAEMALKRLDRAASAGPQAAPVDRTRTVPAKEAKAEPAF